MELSPTVAGIFIANVTTLVITVLGFVFVEIRARRERKWAIQDRLAQTKAIEEKLDNNKAEVLGQTTEAVKKSEGKIEEIHKTQRTNANRLGKKIDHNTQISAKAFVEANNVNEKIASAAERAAALEKRFDGLEEIIYRFEHKIDEAIKGKEDPMTITEVFADRRIAPRTTIAKRKKKE